MIVVELEAILEDIVYMGRVELIVGFIGDRDRRERDGPASFEMSVEGDILAWLG